MLTTQSFWRTVFGVAVEYVCYVGGVGDVLAKRVGFFGEGSEYVRLLSPSTQEPPPGVGEEGEIQHERHMDQIVVGPERMAKARYVQRDGEVDEEVKIVNLEW